VLICINTARINPLKNYEKRRNRLGVSDTFKTPSVSLLPVQLVWISYRITGGTFILIIISLYLLSYVSYRTQQVPEEEVKKTEEELKAQEEAGKSHLVLI